MIKKTDKWTGERLETFVANETMVEHLHRYALTLNFVHEKKVLDIACGEGYGCFLLSNQASSVTGIDIDNATIAKAKEKYKKNNIAFLQGDILKTPFGVAIFDIITCFETLEHTSEHNALIKELKRVLKPGGILFISTPDKSNYSDNRNYQNPFHKKELYIHQFKEIVKESFQFSAFYQQTTFNGSIVISEEKKPFTQIFEGDYKSIQNKTILPAMYWIALASDIELPQLNSSFFQNPQSMTDFANEEIANLKKTLTYRTGNIILSPFKFIRSLFRK